MISETAVRARRLQAPALTPRSSPEDGSFQTRGCHELRASCPLACLPGIPPVSLRIVTGVPQAKTL